MPARPPKALPPPAVKRRPSWLLVTASTAGAGSSLRVYVWRHLRALGGIYLQQAVCILPDRPETTKAVNRLLDKVNREGGAAKALCIAVLDDGQQQDLVASFQVERSDEYHEFVGAAATFTAELDNERAKQRATYAEMEESEAELDRLRIWLQRIRARDYFDAPGGVEATEALDACAADLADFESEAFAAEQPPTHNEVRLRAVPGRATPSRISEGG